MICESPSQWGSLNVTLEKGMRALKEALHEPCSFFYHPPQMCTALSITRPLILLTMLQSKACERPTHGAAGPVPVSEVQSWHWKSAAVSLEEKGGGGGLKRGRGVPGVCSAVMDSHTLPRR